MTAQTPAPPSKTAGASLPRPRRSAIIPPTATLALWRLRQSWRLLLITELGMVAAVLLICVVPLFSQVSISGGLRAALAASTGSRDIGVTAAISDMTQASAKQLKPRVDAMIRSRVGPYLSGAPVFSITSLPMVIYKTQAEAKAGGEAAPNGPGLLLVGRDLGEVSSHAQLTAGRLPLATSSQMEVALTGDVADALQLSLGQTFYVSFRFGPPSIPAVAIPIKVVGLFNAVGGADVYAGQAGQSQGNVVKFGFGGAAPYPGLVSNDAMLSVMGPAILAGVSGSGTGIGYGRGGPLAGWLNWNYPLAVDRITGSDLGALADARNRIQIDLNNQLNGSSGIQFFQTYGALDIVNDYNGRVVASQVIVIVLLLQVMGLILLFVSVMAGILVERQSEAIALLRSRGAYRRQIFGALTLHGLGMSLLALIVGPLVAIPLVRLVAQALLSSAGQQGLSVLDGNPLTVAWTVRWYAFAAIIGAGLAILIAIWRAANRNVLALRRESARTTTRPLWQRLHLDLVFAVIAATGYGLYLFVLDKVGIYAA
ncbi:MAG TPA: FtsX-like permease family protein, partial [Ktedonobacterales bacterium]